MKEIRISVLVAVILLLFTGPAMAAEMNFNQGALNIVDLLRIIVLVAVLVGIVRELFTQRSIFRILGLILATAIVLNVSSVAEMKRLGADVLSMFRSGTTITEQSPPTVQRIETENLIPE